MRKKFSLSCQKWTGFEKGVAVKKGGNVGEIGETKIGGKANTPTGGKIRIISTGVTAGKRG